MCLYPLGMRGLARQAEFRFPPAPVGRLDRMCQRQCLEYKAHPEDPGAFPRPRLSIRMTYSAASVALRFVFCAKDM